MENLIKIRQDFSFYIIKPFYFAYSTQTPHNQNDSYNLFKQNRSIPIQLNSQHYNLTRIWIRHQSFIWISRSEARTSPLDGCSNWAELEDSIYYSNGDNSNSRARNWFANRSPIQVCLTSCALTRLIALLMRYVKPDPKTIALSLLCRTSTLRIRDPRTYNVVRIIRIIVQIDIVDMFDKSSHNKNDELSIKIYDSENWF